MKCCAWAEDFFSWTPIPVRGQLDLSCGPAGVLCAGKHSVACLLLARGAAWCPPEQGDCRGTAWENMGGCHQMAGLCWVWASSGIQRSHTGGFPGLCHDSYTWEELFWAEAGPLTLMNAWSFPSCWLPLWTNFFFFFCTPLPQVASCFSFVAFLLAVPTLACLFLARWMQLSAEWIPPLPCVQGAHSIVGATPKPQYLCPAEAHRNNLEPVTSMNFSNSREMSIGIPVTKAFQEGICGKLFSHAKAKCFWC